MLIQTGMLHAMPMERYDAIVVGSGIGGASAAAVLAHAGRKVLVLEKNEQVGGVLAGWPVRGFRFDIGSHLIPRGAAGPLGRLFRFLGGGPRFLTHPIPVRSRGMFDITAPKSPWGLLATARASVRTLGIPHREARRLARMMLHVFTLTEWELRRLDTITLHDFVRRYTEHPAAYFLFSFLASIFYVLPPWRVAAGEAIRGLRGILLHYALSYVEGGMPSIPRALLAHVTAAGGSVVVSRHVHSIAQAGSELCVTTDDGRTARAKVVVANLSPVDLLRRLDGLVMPPAWVARVQALTPSGNAHQIKLALGRPLVDEGCFIGGLSLSGLTTRDLSLDLMERTVAAIERGSVSDPMAIYAPVPSNFDPTLAPPGKQIIVASIYGPIRPDPADAPGRWQERIMAALYKTLPGLDAALEFVEFMPVPSLGAWMGKSSNAAISTGQVPGQVGRLRFPVVTPCPGLFLCGDGAGGGHGIGTELATRSGMEAAAAALRMLA